MQLPKLGPGVHLNTQKLEQAISQRLEQMTINQKLNIVNKYAPDTTTRDNIQPGQSISVFDVEQEDREHYMGLETREILSSIDYTYTTRKELYLTLSTLADRGVVTDRSAQGVISAISHDENLNDDVRFNSLNYVEKLLNNHMEVGDIRHKYMLESLIGSNNMMEALHDRAVELRLEDGIDEWV